MTMRWDSSAYDKHAHFVSQLGEGVLTLLQPQAGEEILDLGCGDGTLAEEIARSGARVQGVDSSADMIAAAQARGIQAAVCDAHALEFENEFNAVFSNAALHWMKHDPDEVLRRVARALRSGGRFCAEFGVAGNIANISTALHHTLQARGLAYEDYNPWFFPEPEDYRAKLQAANFTLLHWEVFPRPTELPTDIFGWLKVFAKPFLKDIPPAEHAAFLTAVANEMEADSKTENGIWIANYVRCRFLAIKK